MNDLGRLLRPSSIAVMGSVWAENVIKQCQKMGFAGQIYPVHPHKSHIGGIVAFTRLQDLPQSPDASFIGVNRHATVEVVKTLSDMGAGGAVCFAAGWAEAGEADLQNKLVQAAGKMPILGPNCYGVINYLDGALLWPDQHGGRPVEKGVALVSQSSNIVINLSMQTRGLPVAYVACLGNAAQIGLAELSSALLADPRVTALGLYVEGFDDAAAFAAMAEAARLAGKGIVCLKSGKTEASRQAAASHTASLAGGGVASSAFLRQAGVAEVTSLDHMLETLKIFHCYGPMIGPRLCSLSCSGGEAGLVADLAASHHLGFEPLPQAQSARLSEILGPIVNISNPLDYNTFIWGDGPRTTDVFTTMLSAYDVGIYIIDPPRPDRCDPSSYQPALDAVIVAGQSLGKPAFPVASLPENFDEERAIALIERGIAPLMGLEAALGAIKAAQTPASDKGWRPFAPLAFGESHLLGEDQAKALLTQAGILVPKGVSAPSLAALLPHVANLTPPFVLKGLGFAHKTEVGAVRLHLNDLNGQDPILGASGYLLEEMVAGALAELLIGVRRDPIYGVTMTLGFGGVLAELLADTVTVILPATDLSLRAGLQTLRLWPTLTGYRGKPTADVDSFVRMALAIANLIETDNTIEEIEINPVMLGAQGAVAVDALIRKVT